MPIRSLHLDRPRLLGKKLRLLFRKARSGQEVWFSHRPVFLSVACPFPGSDPGDLRGPRRHLQGLHSFVRRAASLIVLPCPSLRGMTLMYVALSLSSLHPIESWLAPICSCGISASRTRRWISRRDPDNVGWAFIPMVIDHPLLHRIRRISRIYLLARHLRSDGGPRLGVSCRRLPVCHHS